MQVARTAAPDDATCLFFLSFKPVNSAIIVEKRGMPCETLILF